MKTRPLTEAEQKHLQAYYGVNKAGDVPLHAYVILFSAYLCLAHILFLITFWPFYYLAPMVGLSEPKSYTMLFILGSAVAMAYLMRNNEASNFVLNSKMRDKVTAAVTNNQAEEYDLLVTEVVEKEEFEDEGAGFFLQLADNRVLYVMGQDLYEYSALGEPADTVPATLFPATHIRFVRESQTGIRLGLTGSGEKLKAQAVVADKDGFVKNREYHGPTDGTFYEGDLASVLAQFGLTRRPLDA